MTNKDPKKNASGCHDLTAYEAMTSIDDEDRFNKLIKTIKYICRLAGFRIQGRIVLIDNRSGRVWK